ncbi:DsrE family protein [Haloferax mucosum]|nr:DsrE family protein [Haloferax mucosum]
MNVVFHVSSADLGDWRHALRNVRNLLDDDTVEVDSVTLLANGDAALLFLEGSPVTDRFEPLIADGIRCRACQNSLDGRGFDTDQLADGVEAVPSGVGELVTRQAAGDAYLKVP